MQSGTILKITLLMLVCARCSKTLMGITTPQAQPAPQTPPQQKRPLALPAATFTHVA
jgi:hypothetical protein